MLFDIVPQTERVADIKDKVKVVQVTLRSGPRCSRLLGTTSEVSEGPIFKQEQIARAVELSLGVRSPTQMQLITDDP